MPRTSSRRPQARAGLRAHQRTRLAASVVVATVLAVGALASGCQPALERTVTPPVVVDEFAAYDVSLHGRERLELACGDGAVIEYEAVTGLVDGAAFLVAIPAAWEERRQLVLYAHGYIPPDEPPGFPDPLPPDIEALRDGLLCEGFALAASSYARHGYAVSDGVRDTHLLNGVVRQHVGIEPRHTLLMGQSMGALISAHLAERYPERYDGALVSCGPLAGSLVQLNYVGHVRVLTDAFVPELFPEDAVTPTSRSLAEVQRLVAELDPQALEQLASVRLPGSTLFHPGGVPLLPSDPHASDHEASLRASLVSALSYGVVGMADVLERGGGVPFDNSLTYYQSPLLSPLATLLLNERVARHVRSTSARQHWWRWAQPRGALQIPIVNLHTLADPDVPFAHAVVYDQLTRLAGSREFLLTYPVDRYGHCAFTLEEVVMAFAYLVAWVETGSRPPLPDTDRAP